MLDEALAWTEEAERILARTEPSRLRATAEMRAYVRYCRGEYVAEANALTVELVGTVEEYLESIRSMALQFEGWRDCVSIAVLLGSFAEAWDAVDHAATLAPQLENPEHATAIVLYARAYVGSQPDVWMLDEALAWTEEAERTFARTEPSRLRATAEMRAFIHYCRGQYLIAANICAPLWKERPDVAFATNYAAYLTGCGNFAEAERILAWSLPRIPPEEKVIIAQQVLIAARCHAGRSQWEAAIAAFTRSSKMFSDLEMQDTVIRIDLSRVRAMVESAPESITIADQAIRDLRKVVALSAELDAREPSRRRRFTAEALGYLRELAEANALTVEFVAHVEQYLDAITRGPARPFVRPAPVLLM